MSTSIAIRHLYTTSTVSTQIKKEINMRVKIEIRAAEGGDDSKLFVKDLAQAYSKFLNRVG